VSGATFETLLALDARLVAAGHHPLTPWWKAQLERFYAHPTAKTLVARVGRGGTKSHAATKVALNETLFGDWAVPLGEVHYWPFVSIDKPEAAQRLRLIERFLIDLGVPHDCAGDEITLRDLPRAFRVFACQVGSVSGPRAYGFNGDELAKWKSADKYSNPAGEVIASANAMTITHPDARRLLISSAVSLIDYHAKRFEMGDTDDQLVCSAPTWIANPSVTEEQTHKLEPDERIWKREYGAIPQAAALAAFDSDAVQRAFVDRGEVVLQSPVGIIDASSGKKDSWTWGVCGWCRVEGVPRLVFVRVGGFDGGFWSQMSGDAVVATVANQFKSMRVHKVFGDQREALMIGAGFRRHGLAFTEIPWTAPTKERAVGMLRRWLADDTLSLPEHEKLRDELLMFEERATPSGSFTFGARGTGHDDYVALLLTAAMVDNARLLPASPNRRSRMFEALSGMSAQDVERRMLGSDSLSHIFRAAEKRLAQQKANTP
jgi:hypothetical protein